MKSKKTNIKRFMFLIGARLLSIFKLCIVTTIVIHAFLILQKGVVISTVFLTIALYTGTAWVLIVLIKMTSLNKNLIVTIVVTSCLFLGIDLWLRYEKKWNQQYLEKNGGWTYESMYKIHNWWGRDYNPFHIPYDEQTERKAEFTYHHQWNNIGLKGSDFLPKKGDEFRIAMLGDSFVEGAGTPDDSTSSVLLQKKFQQNCTSKKNVNVLNFGQSGNDVVYAFHALQYDFMRFKPDMVVININNSDIDDIIVRGGPERYNAKGKLYLRTGPWWEIFYGSSFIVRYIIHDWFQYNWMLLKKTDNMNEYTVAANKIVNTVLEMYNYCKKKEIKFLVVLSPHQYEMENQHFAKQFGIVYDRLSREYRLPVCLLPEFYNNHGMTPENAYQFYWQVDYHNNSRGYQLYAEGVYAALVPLLD